MSTATTTDTSVQSGKISPRRTTAQPSNTPNVNTSSLVLNADPTISPPPSGPGPWEITAVDVPRAQIRVRASAPIFGGLACGRPIRHHPPSRALHAAIGPRAGRGSGDWLDGKSGRGYRKTLRPLNLNFRYWHRPRSVGSSRFRAAGDAALRVLGARGNESDDYRWESRLPHCRSRP